MSRGMRPNQPADQTAATASPSAPTHSGSHNNRHSKDGMRVFRVGSIALLFSVAVLVIAIALSLVFGGTTPEAKFVSKDKYQAVFLNGGQVYFGKILKLNDQYMTVADIYYLRVNQQVQPGQQQSANQNDISLVKLGCELHGPQDAMVINREQVVFWENLKDDGQVAKAVADYKKQNPGGQKCNTSGSTTTQPTQPSNTNTTNTNTNSRWSLNPHNGKSSDPTRAFSNLKPSNRPGLLPTRTAR